MSYYNPYTFHLTDHELHFYSYYVAEICLFSFFLEAREWENNDLLNTFSCFVLEGLQVFSHLVLRIKIKVDITFNIYKMG
jgi:hypothetical protein